MDTLKGTGMIRKESSDGIGYSVIELNGISHVFAAAVPRSGETLREQAADALKTICAIDDAEGVHGQIVKQAIFLRDPSLLDECRQIIREFYGDKMPATTYICQQPCSGKLISIEALGVGQDGQGVEIQRVSEQIVITRHGGVSWIHCGQIVPETDAKSVYERSLSAFGRMKQMLDEHDINFNQIIRTWLYLGDIVGAEGETQRYKELNRARTDFFKGIEFAKGMMGPGVEREIYPASTGIGTDNGDVLMSAIAVDAKPGQVTFVPLENPEQTSAFDYGAVYSPKSPKFARAMALAAGTCSTIFVSGTASITDSETRFVGDVEGQTRQTLDNIEALISEANLAKHGQPGLGTTLDGVAFVRVYVKHQKDYAKIRAICEERLGELPTIYAVADVCRPDLLVEIEAVAFSCAE